MNQLIVTVSAAVIPAVFLVVYFWKSDRFPEPPKVVMTTFILGILSIIPSTIFALPFYVISQKIQNPYLYGIWQAFMCAAIPEESAKFLVIFFYCYKHPALDEVMDGFVYGATASLGFAALENIMYVADGGLSVAVTRAFTSVPAHAFFGMFTGYYLAVYKMTSVKKKSILMKGLMTAVLLHGLYDVPLLMLRRVVEIKYHAPPLFYSGSAIASWGIIFFMYRIGLNNLKAIKREQDRGWFVFVTS